MKTCSDCLVGEAEPKGRRCRTCHHRRIVWRRNNPALAHAEDEQRRNRTEKICKTCRTVKPISEYSRRRGGYYESSCKKCGTVRAVEHSKSKPEFRKAWYAKRRDYQLAKCRQWYEANRDYAILSVREWQESHPEMTKANRRVSQANRKARVRGAVGRHDVKDVDALFSAQCGRCAACSADITGGFHVDHHAVDIGRE